MAIQTNELHAAVIAVAGVVGLMSPALFPTFEASAPLDERSPERAPA